MTLLRLKKLMHFQHLELFNTAVKIERAYNHILDF